MLHVLEAILTTMLIVTTGFVLIVIVRKYIDEDAKLTLAQRYRECKEKSDGKDSSGSGRS